MGHLQGYQKGDLRVWIIVTAGLDGAVGGRCLLELPLLTHPHCDNVLMEAISK